MYKSAIILSSILTSVHAQQIGTQMAEVHPTLSWSTYSAGGTATTNAGSITLDANWRWVHGIGDTTNCYTGNTWDTSICDTNAACATACAVDGADYSGTYGITTAGNSITLGFVTSNSNGKNVGSRNYLMADDTHYEVFKLLNQEFSITIDDSNLPCGLNGAVYFVVMDADGGVSTQPSNAAGAQYGVGYCDSQCPTDLKFIGGAANIEGWTPDSNSANSGTGGSGSCCAEIDIWEGNSMSQALTPHPCTTPTQTVCTGDACGGTYSTNRYAGTCDPDGCDFNPYRLGNTTFYGPGGTIDSTKPVQVITQFITDDGTDTGTLSAIKRFYVQGGVVYPQPDSNIAGITGNTIDTDFCTAEITTFGETTSFSDKGGFGGVSAALEAGVVLVMSLWDDYAVNMLWLDSTYPTNETAANLGAVRGSCATTSGSPPVVEAQDASASVTYSDIRVGPINSTFSAGTGTGTGGSTPPSSTSSTPPSSTSPASGSIPEYGQCGGTGWAGSGACAAGFTCTALNAYYSQCL